MNKKLKNLVLKGKVTLDDLKEAEKMITVDKRADEFWNDIGKYYIQQKEFAIEDEGCTIKLEKAFLENGELLHQTVIVEGFGDEGKIDFFWDNVEYFEDFHKDLFKGVHTLKELKEKGLKGRNEVVDILNRLSEENTFAEFLNGKID